MSYKIKDVDIKTGKNTINTLNFNNDDNVEELPISNENGSTNNEKVAANDVVGEKGSAAYDFMFYEEDNKNTKNNTGDYAIRTVNSFSTVGRDLWNAIQQTRAHSYYEGIHDGKEEVIIDYRSTNKNISESGNQRINQIYNYFLNKGYNDVQIAAIIGNLQQEATDNVNPSYNIQSLLDTQYTSNNFRDIDGTEIYKAEDFDLSRAHDSDYKNEWRKIILESHTIPKYGGIGIVQWTNGVWSETKGEWVEGKYGDRKAKFLNWCKKGERNWYDLDVQLDYLSKEIDELSNSAKSEFNSFVSNDKETLNRAVHWFAEYIEGTNDSIGRREDFASNIYDAIKAGK